MSRTLLTEAQGYELLKTYGIPIPKYVAIQSAGEAARAAQEIGFPVVMKVISPQVIHKSDAGGVITGISTPEDATRAFDTISRNVHATDPAARITGMMIEQQLPPGLELIIGGKTDAAFGKVITIGIGGTLVELLNDVTIAVLPVNDDEIRHMIHRLKGYRMIAGFRHQPARDETELVGVIRAAINLFLKHPEIEEFDINPFVLYEHGGCAVDARFYQNESPRAEITGIPETPVMPASLLKINSVAIVGASQDPNKVGYAICRNMLAFPGNLYPVNPKSEMILGKTSYPKLAGIPGAVDAVVIAIPAPGVPGVVKEAGEKGIPLAIIITSGFREGGAAGKSLEDEILAIAKKYHVRIMGPNCLGLMLPMQGINTTFDPVSPGQERSRLSPRAGQSLRLSWTGACPRRLVFLR